MYSTQEKQLKLNFSIRDNSLYQYFSMFSERRILRVSLPKTGPLRFGSKNQFPLNFAHEYILVQK